MTRYTTLGLRDGSCGHAHTTPEDAIACIRRFEATVWRERADAGIEAPWDTDRRVKPLAAISSPGCSARALGRLSRCQLDAGHPGAHEAWSRRKPRIAGTTRAPRAEAARAAVLAWLSEHDQVAAHREEVAPDWPSRGAVVEALSYLRRRGLVTRRRSLTDRRKMLWGITERELPAGTVAALLPLEKS